MTEAKFEVIESRHLRCKCHGKTYGLITALPHGTWEDFEVVMDGWTVRNPFTNQTGVGRPPWATQAEAQAYADKYRPSRIGYGD
jgi:hypothetical protein